MNKPDWDNLAENFQETVFEIIHNDIHGVIREEIHRLAQLHRSAADLGCGTGSLLDVLSHAFDQVYAVDYAADLIQQARGRVQSETIQFRTQPDRLQTPVSQSRSHLWKTSPDGSKTPIPGTGLLSHIDLSSIPTTPLHLHLPLHYLNYIHLESNLLAL